MTGLAALALVSASASAQATAGGLEGCPGGYQRQGSLYDFALGRRWMVFARCGHPEMPRLAVDTSEAATSPLTVPAPTLQRAASERSSALRNAPEVLPASSFSSSSSFSSWNDSEVPPEVVAGSHVRLWKQDGRVEIELSGVALEAAAVGAPVRVRVHQGGTGTGPASSLVMRGTVRGPGSVELAGPAGFGSAGFVGEAR